MNKPYLHIKINNKRFVRLFFPWSNSTELVWHRDKKNRVVKTIFNQGWELQFDDSIPINISGITRIHSNKYHRVIKGFGVLIVLIQE